jgi:hypothetical protein
VTAREAREQFDTFVRSVEERKVAEGGAATDAEVAEARRLLFEEWHGHLLYEWESAKLRTFNYLPRPDEPTAEWEKIEAELREPAPPPKPILVRLAPEASTGKSGRPQQTISKQTLLNLLARGLERARSTGKRRQPSYEAIADEFGLKRTWTTPIVQWAERHQREAREAIALSRTPPRFTTIVSD